MGKERFLMESGNQQKILNNYQKSILIIFFVLIICFLFFFRNLFFKPTFLLKSFGESSVNPELAFENDKPTFLEFYAEWCEVCKEMALKFSLKDEYEKDINFVFLNVDNTKWDSYLRKFAVNGIPQINLFDKNGNLSRTFIGKQEDKIIKFSLENLKDGIKSKGDELDSDFSIIKENKNIEVSPRSHG